MSAALPTLRFTLVFRLCSYWLKSMNTWACNTEQTVSVFGDVATNIEKSMKDVAGISDMVQQNAEIVKLAVSQLGQISDVVEENVRISQNTKEASSDMADITDNLLELMEG